MVRSVFVNDVVAGVDRLAFGGREPDAGIGRHKDVGKILVGHLATVGHPMRHDDGVFVGSLLDSGGGRVATATGESGESDQTDESDGDVLHGADEYGRDL